MRLTYIVSIFALLAFFLNIFESGNIMNPVIYLPLFFAIFNFIFIHPYFIWGPGFTISYLVMIIRYIISPYFLLQSDFFSTFNSYTYEFVPPVIMMILEMFAILLTTYILKKDEPTNLSNENITKDFSYFFPFVLLFFSALLSAADPVPLSGFHSIFSGETEMYYTEDLEESTQGLPRLLTYTQKAIIISAIFFFYKLYTNKLKNHIYWIGLCIVILLSGFYFDRSRNSMLIPMLTIIFLYAKVYKEVNQKILKYTKIILSIIIIVSMSYLTLLKQFETTTFDTELINNDIRSTLLERYFGGSIGVWECTQHEQEISSQINSTTFLTETFGYTFLIGRFFDNSNRTSVFYNNSVGSHSFIIPTVAESFFHFGFLFCWVLSSIIFVIILFLDKKFLKTKSIELAFVYAFISITLGWMHTGNYIICMSTINVWLIFYFIMYINMLLPKRTPPPPPTS